jgi:hypothetical protein
MGLRQASAALAVPSVIEREEQAFAMPVGMNRLVPQMVFNLKRSHGLQACLENFRVRGTFKAIFLKEGELAILVIQMLKTHKVSNVELVVEVTP